MLLNLNAWCHKWEIYTKYLCCIVICNGCLGKITLFSWVPRSSVTFFVKPQIQRTDKQWLFGCGYPADIFCAKTTKEKNCQCLLPMIKHTFKWKNIILENLYVPHELKSFPILQDFRCENSDIHECDWYCIMKCVNTT